MIAHTDGADRQTPGNVEGGCGLVQLEQNPGATLSHERFQSVVVSSLGGPELGDTPMAGKECRSMEDRIVAGWPAT